MSKKTRTTLLEVELSKGSYTIICECEKTQYMKDYTLSLCHQPTASIYMEEEDNLVTKRAYKDIICGMAIQHGTKEFLEDNNATRRYSFFSEKLGLFVYVYTNNTHKKYVVMEKLNIVGEHECNVNVDQDGYMKFYMPAMSKKCITFKFKDAKNSKVQIDEHTMQVVS